MTELFPPACAMAGESEELPRLWVVGCATSVPGRTKEQGAQVILDALCRAAQGEAVLEKPGQRGAWLNKRFIATELNAGGKTWKFFKRHYAEIIELDEEQQWVRLAQEQALTERLPDEAGEVVLQ